MEPNNLFTGIIDDPRKDTRVQEGHQIGEVLAESAPFNWVQKDISQVVSYPVWDQAGTSACVAFSKAKQISIMIFSLTGVWIDFSPASIYQLRANKPAGGMSIPDANNIVNTTGVTLEALMKSQNLTEDQINTVKRSKVASLFAIAIAEAVVRYLYVPVDIDRIAQTIESKKGVSLLIWANYDEYARMVPVVIDPNLTYENAPIRHEVVGVDYFLDAGGVKRIYVNDSAHFGGLAVRELTSGFLAKRCILADALDVFTFDPETSNKPHYTFNRDLKFSPITTPGDPDVVALQDILKWEQLFPSNQASTGYYGALTAKAVLDFRTKYGISSASDPLGRSVGPLTRAKLNSVYGS